MNVANVPWIVAETYPIEAFWETQILEGGGVVAVARGYSQREAKERAMTIVGAVNREKGYCAA